MTSQTMTLSGWAMSEVLKTGLGIHLGFIVPTAGMAVGIIHGTTHGMILGMIPGIMAGLAGIIHGTTTAGGQAITDGAAITAIIIMAEVGMYIIRHALQLITGVQTTMVREAFPMVAPPRTVQVHSEGLPLSHASLPTVHALAPAVHAPVALTHVIPAMAQVEVGV